MENDMGNMRVLPDSRLQTPKDCVTYDWHHSDRWTFDGFKWMLRPVIIRLEMEPIFCISCHKPQGWVARNVGMSHVHWLCQRCSETYGKEAAESECSDAAFWRKVDEGMIRRFGKRLTGEELEQIAAVGGLGRELEMLERESPYRGTGHHP
jgi:hypothetical protein